MRNILFFFLILIGIHANCHDNSKFITVKLCTQEMLRPRIPSFIKKNNGIKAKHTMIVYVDKEDCPSCFVSHLYQWEIFMKECKENKIDLNFMFVFNPPETGLPIFIKQLSSSSISNTSYIDAGGIFRRRNPWLINDPSKHVFIIGDTMIPFFVDVPPYDRKFMYWLRNL